MRRRAFGIAIVAVLMAAAAWGAGTITGTVTNQANDRGVGGVTVVVNETGQVAVTRPDGRFRIDNVPAGVYSVSYSLADDVASEQDVAVTDGNTTSFDKSVGWDVNFAETITVVSASRRRERIVEAPAAVTSISEEQIEREISHGQLPKLLEFTPGVQVTQSGNYDYNLNTRGFNSSLNRRVAVLVDGRDSAVPFLASQEWTIISNYMNDLSSAELVRGPSSALYGKNAFNGVLNLVTKQPRDSEGGELRLTGGELSTLKVDFRHAGSLGNEWYYKVSGNYMEGDDFSEDRDVGSGGPEYAGLLPEVIPRVLDSGEILFGNLRVDKHLKNGDFFSLETGVGEFEGPTAQTGIGRFSLPKIEREWSRFNYTSLHWNFLGYLNDRFGDRQTSLQSGSQTFLDTKNYHFELQTNWAWNEDKIRFVAGVSHREEEIDTLSPITGLQTLVFEAVDSDSQAFFTQIDFDINKNLKLVLAGRYDDSTLHDEQFSPKAALVWTVAPNNSLRFTYNEAFQVANYSEFFLQADGAPPIDLSAFEAICAPTGVSCGFDGLTRILALGNKDLEVEEVTSWEIGYTGVIGGKAFVTLDYYSSELENFITDLLPNVGTALGRLNPNFGAYQPPADLPEPFRTLLLQNLQGALGPTFFALTNNLDGDPIVGAVSYTNFGQVDTQGLDLGINVFINPEWRVNFSYSWFDFDIKVALPGDPLVPNAPENSASAGFGYVGSKFNFAVNWRWTEDFFWSVGTLFRGEVPSYSTADINANYNISERIQIGVNIANAFDEEHFEIFGGDVLGRRALAHVAFKW